MISYIPKGYISIFVNSIVFTVLITISVFLSQYKMSINFQFLKLKEQTYLRDQMIKSICKLNGDSLVKCEEILKPYNDFSRIIFYKNFKHFFEEYSTRQIANNELLEALFNSASIVDQSNYLSLNQINSSLSNACVKYNEKLLPILHYLAFAEAGFSCPISY